MSNNCEFFQWWLTSMYVHCTCSNVSSDHNQKHLSAINYCRYRIFQFKQRASYCEDFLKSNRVVSWSNVLLHLTPKVCVAV